MIRVLLLDDDVDFQVTVRHQAEASTRDSFHVDCASSVPEANDLMAGEAYDYYLVDYQLTGSSNAAPDFIRHVLTVNPHARIGLCTVHRPVALDEYMVSMLAEDCVHFIPKDVLIETPVDSLILREIGRKLRVLVVEDDADDRELIVDMLEQPALYRFEVTTAVSVEDALERVAEQEFDAFLVDYFLQPGTAAEIIDKMPEEELRKPFVLLTVRNPMEFDANTVRLIGRGQVRFLSKHNLNSQRLMEAIFRGALSGSEFMKALST